MPTNDPNIKKSLFRHHACLLVGDKKYWQEILEKELKNFLKVDNLNSSPDIWWQKCESSFGVKEAHVLIERSARRSFGGRGRFFVLEISSITPEAQNALLKTFEEPTADTHFLIIARLAEIFLPTLRSRMVILTSDQDLATSPLSVIGDLASKFLKLDLPERLEFIRQEFLPARAGGKNKDKTKGEIISFIADLEKTLWAGIELKKITKDEEIALYELAKCQRYLQNPRSSNRLILEHLALILPSVRIFNDSILK